MPFKKKKKFQLKEAQLNRLYFCSSLCFLAITIRLGLDPYPVFTRGVTVHRHDGLVRTSVLKSRFGTGSVQQGGEN